MIGLVNTLSSLGTTAYQPTDSQVQLKISEEYLINSDCIVEMKVYSSDDSDLLYKLNPEDDRQPAFRLRVSQTNAELDTIADTDPDSNLMVLDVFENDYGENALTFAECASLSTVAKYYNVEDIVWGEQNAAKTRSMLLIARGGQSVEKIFVDSGLDQIMDLVVTGTTTTTTSSTSSTTTSA